MLKIQGIEKGLTWAQDHAHIQLPNLPDDVFSSVTNNTASSSNTTSPSHILLNSINLAALKTNELLANVYGVWQSTIRYEVEICSLFLLMWTIVVILAFSRCFWVEYRYSRTLSRRKAAKSLQKRLRGLKFFSRPSACNVEDKAFPLTSPITKFFDRSDIKLRPINLDKPLSVH
ncbi:MAG: hypothetical protein O7C62_04345, partial [Rickettsia endosymbiont of Ixodes persulcatus]|nr:hypothetical protein [Rickettsia endosymbiont of Ixodes persulcatus]